jgi:3-methylcrotonyl-CoA carboxylase alpha subunit
MIREVTARFADQQTAPLAAKADAEAAALLAASPGSGPWSAALGFRANAAPRAEARLIDDSGQLHVVVEEIAANDPADEVLTFSAGFTSRFTLERIGSGSHHDAHDGDILSPMPGKIIAVEVSAGQSVTKGQKLLTLEGMKMEHTLTAPFDGVVTELFATLGAQMQVEAMLASIVPADF